MFLFYINFNKKIEIFKKYQVIIGFFKALLILSFDKID